LAGTDRVFVCVALHFFVEFLSAMAVISVLCLEIASHNQALALTLSMLNADIKFSSTGCFVFPILGILGP